MLRPFHSLLCACSLLASGVLFSCATPEPAGSDTPPADPIEDIAGPDPVEEPRVNDGGLTYTSGSMEEVQAILTGMGIDSDIDEDGDIRFGLEGYVAFITVSDSDLKLFSIFSESYEADYATSNDWNQGFKYFTSFVDSAGRAHLESFLRVGMGSSVEAIRDFVEMYRLGLSAFDDHLREARGGRVAPPA